MANPRNAAGKVNVKKGNSQPKPPAEVFTPVGDTPSNKLPTTRPAGNPNATPTPAKPGQMAQSRRAPGQYPAQQPSTQVPPST